MKMLVAKSFNSKLIDWLDPGDASIPRGNT